MTTNPWPLPTYWFICHYCRQTFTQHSLLVFHKLESHPLEFAEEKRIQNYQRIHQNVLETFSSDFSGGGPTKIPMKSHERTSYSYFEYHEPSQSSSVASNGSLLTRENGAFEKLGELGRTHTTPGSCSAGHPTSFHARKHPNSAHGLNDVISTPTKYRQNLKSVEPLNFYLADEANDPQGSGEAAPRASQELEEGALGNIACPQCFKQFRSRDFFRASLHDHHSDDRPYVCTHCEDRFVSAQNLSNHRRSHGLDGPDKCLHGDKLYNSACKSKDPALPELSRTQIDGAEASERSRAGQREDVTRPEAQFLMDASTLTPLQKTAPVPWVIAGRLRQIEIEPISYAGVAHAASAWRPKLLTSVIKSMRSGRQLDPRTTPLKCFGKFKCPLCETRFGRTRTVRCHLITHHRVSTANQKSVGFNRSSSSSGNNMTILKALANDLKDCIGQIVETAEANENIRSKFSRVGRSNSFQVDLDP